MLRRVHSGIGLSILIVLLLTLGAAGASPPATPADAVAQSWELRMRPLPDGIRRVRLATDEGGRQWFVLLKVGGGEQRLSPDEFAARMQHDHESRSLFYRFLNITSPVGLAWVGLGLLGQILFTGRMVLQWVVSERAERSVVPVQFWWMSLAGATMLMIYFVWRRDVIGVLGQSTGWIIYARNLRLIYRSQRS